jgi:hypothetical protein
MERDGDSFEDKHNTYNRLSPELHKLVHQISESEGYNDAPQAYQCGNTPHL